MLYEKDFLKNFLIKYKKVLTIKENKYMLIA